MLTRLRMWIIRMLLRNTNISVVWNAEVHGDLIVAAPCVVENFVVKRGSLMTLYQRDWDTTLAFGMDPQMQLDMGWDNAEECK